MFQYSLLSSGFISWRRSPELECKQTAAEIERNVREHEPPKAVRQSVGCGEREADDAGSQDPRQP